MKIFTLGNFRCSHCCCSQRLIVCILLYPRPSPHSRNLPYSLTPGHISSSHWDCPSTSGRGDYCLFLVSVLYLMFWEWSYSLRNHFLFSFLLIKTTPGIWINDRNRRELLKIFLSSCLSNKISDNEQTFLGACFQDKCIDGCLRNTLNFLNIL